ncbi:MAG TPA: LacI family DNA-binding transcriptional regulator [Candidatus Limnocylindria bacterium]|nr:LacI family DNA-binding transcriptional regulator [Candidatus Limnocylindria bacterium]
MAATIRDISKLAGVSIATVSKVLGGDYSRVSEATRTRVLETAKTLRYRPNLLARGLVSRKSSLLGLIIPDIANPYYADMCRGMADEAQGHGLSTLILNTDRESAKERRAIQTVTEYAAAGAILVGLSGSVAECAAALERDEVPFVLADCGYVEAQRCVYVDDFTGSLEAVRYLIGQGHRAIAHLSGFPAPGDPRDARLRGYREALAQAGIPFDPALVRGGGFDLRTGEEQTFALLDEGRAFTAVACGNDLIALGAMRALRERGKAVPEDVSLIGFDDVNLLYAMEPRLTTVRQPAYDLGRAASGMLCKAIGGGEPGERSIRFTPTLVVRDTVRKL